MTTKRYNPGKVDAQAHDAVAKATVDLLRAEPFYAHVLAGVSRIFGDQVPTIAVSCSRQGFVLWTNSRFFVTELSKKERVAVLKHEVLHLVLKHLFRSSHSDPELHNVAADLVVNQWVEPWPLPEGAVHLSSFPDLKLEPDQTMEWYLERLRKLRLPSVAGTVGPPAIGGDGTPEGGSCILDKLRDTANRRGDHSMWGEGEKTSDADSIWSAAMMDALRNLVASARNKLSRKDWGDLPLGLRCAVEEIAAPPVIHWKRVLRMFSASCNRTRLKTSRRKTSKRFPGNPGSRILRLQHVAVAVDTSGSIDNEMLRLFWNEIVGIHKAGAEITVMDCDAVIHNVWKLRRQKPRPNFTGGGGTCFDPVFQWLRDNHRKGIAGCIYLTDGYAPQPTVRPPCPVLWVVYRYEGSFNHLKPGRVIFLK
jgi:predicted metal-dependent peptidase